MSLFGFTCDADRPPTVEIEDGKVVLANQFTLNPADARDLALLLHRAALKVDGQPNASDVIQGNGSGLFGIR